MVAPGRVDGGLHVLVRHAEPRDGHRPHERRRGQLGVVGLPAHRHDDGVHLRQAVAALGAEHRPRLLRAALFGPSGGLPARIPRCVPRALLQRDHYGDRVARGHQDRRGDLRPLPRGHARDRADGRGRVRDARRTHRVHLGGFLPVHGGDGGRGRGGLLRGEDVRGGRHGLAFHPFREPRREGQDGDVPLRWRERQPFAVHDAPRPARRRAVVGHVVPRGRARRRRLHRPAHAVREGRAERRGRHAPLQFPPLRAALLALAHRGPRLDRGDPRHGLAAGLLAGRVRAVHQGGHGLPRDDREAAVGVAGARGGLVDRRLHEHDRHADQLGFLLPRAGFLRALSQEGRLAEEPGARGSADHGRAPHLHRRHGACPRERQGRLRPHAPDRRGNRSPLRAALVLDAHQRLERDIRHGDFLPRGVLLRVRGAALRPDHAGGFENGYRLA